ncbi:hypothetical protein VE03_08952 [Pseudogymnoascus sp. 23342-1-I1]|nr:hypothetical protein VE03_08952 [Pseudogymnoascus sp. 23342-1-I1]
MEIIDAPLGCLNIPLPRCIRKLVKVPPVPIYNPCDEHVLNLIRNFGWKYGRHKNEIQKACDLATGYSDLVVILERPARNHNYSPDFNKFVADCRTLDAVDKLIKFATNKTRSIRTVSVFDALSLKPNEYDERPTNDECYSLVEKMLTIKKPKVVICCWSDRNAKCSNRFVGRFIGGGVGRQPIRVDVDIEWGPVVIRSFHPATAVCYRPYNPDYQILLTYHFIAAFLELAISVATDPEHESDPALALDQLPTCLALLPIADTELSHGIEEPLWLEQINTRSKSSIKKKEKSSYEYAEAYSRAFDIIYNILGEGRTQIIGLKNPNDAIYLLLQRLKCSTYENGSTEISKLYLLWQEYFKCHPNYEWGLDLLIDIANKQEWIDPRDGYRDDSRGYSTDDMVEALEKLQID